MKDILYRLFEHQYLGRDEARTILQNIAEGKYNDSQIASLITVYLMRNISVEELAGFREALLEMRVPVDLSEFKPIDIVGTGGDGKNTFNISTASCFVVAGAGYHCKQRYDIIPQKRHYRLKNSEKQPHQARFAKFDSFAARIGKTGRNSNRHCIHAQCNGCQKQFPNTHHNRF